MASATITATTAVEFIPAIWSAGVLSAVEFSGQMQKRVNRKYESELKLGNTLNIPRQSNLTTQTKSSGLAQVVSFEAITESKQQIVVSTHEYAAFLIEDIVAAQAKEDIRGGYEKKIGYALARGREVALAALPASFSQVAGALGVDSTADDFLLAYQYLLAAGLLENEPTPDDNFSLFLSAAAYVSSLKVDAFTNRDYNTSGDAIQRAYIGKIYGIPVYVSNLIAASGAGHNNCMFHREGMALIVQKEVPIRAQYKIDNLADAVVGWNIYGVAEVNFPPETPGGGAAVDNRDVLVRGL